MADRTAVVLFNLGGPDRPEAVRPFLYNLFADPAILRLPAPARQGLAWLIAKRREATARHIYDQMGGSSPILGQTLAQAAATERKLGAGWRVFVAMRYWHPLARETVRQVALWRPRRVVLLPLYPQFSTTTTASSFSDWRKAANAVGLYAPTTGVCCYPVEAGFVATQAEFVKAALAEAPRPCRVLFSAHGLPQRIVDQGDPYPVQVEATARAVVTALALPGLDWRISYQSRVGPLAWLGPATDAEIRQAGADGVALIVVPIAFVSEHSETLVELDLEYAKLAKDAGVSHYRRVPAAGTAAAFIDGLARLARLAAADAPAGDAPVCGAGCARAEGRQWLTRIPG